MIDILIILAPVFTVLALGYGFGHTRLFPENSSSALIAFVWYVAIPALLFQSLASRPIPFGELYLILGYYSAMLLVYGVAMLVMKFVFKRPLEEQAMYALATCFANGGFVGIPIIDGAFGEEGVRLLLIILSFHSLTLLTVTTVFVEKGRANTGVLSILFRTGKSIKDNPIILALVAGFIWSGLGLPYPVWLDHILALPAAAASPVGLFAVGLSLVGVKLAGDLPQAVGGVLIKLCILPAIMYLVTHFIFDLQPLWVAVAVLTAALPSGMIPYTFALQQDIAPRRVASIILLSVTAAPVTMFTIMLLLGVGQG
ncbi:membrane protein [Kordiimonas sediminis]|uniref:Membrane protein n=1 Tax=Kordiimonas sediminis TaxID=1735581 RepID=A0A919ALJ0_9PROT|nr:AEC family transporter [Kordiimonas sediminis]GHF14235.1 membrane protein [Kordiimonas sediminis]